MVHEHSPATPGTTSSEFSAPAWLAVIASVAVVLAGFWVLLGHRFSPEIYEARPVVVDTTEMTWTGIVVVIAITMIVLSRQHGATCRRIAAAMAPLVIVSGLVAIKSWAGLPVKCYDAILFSLACGWSVVFGLRGRDLAVPMRVGRVLVWTFGIGLGVYFVWQQTRYFNDLALGYSDCGESARVMHNTLHNPSELFLRVNPELPLFYDHFQPAVLTFAPLWALWEGMRQLIVWQVLAVLGCAVPIYWMGRRLFRDETAALLLAMSWLVYPSVSQVIYRVSYGFHWSSFCLLLYFVAAACWLNGRHRWALVAAAGALLLKEEAAIVIGMFGLYLALFGRARRAGVALAVGAFAYFFVVTQLVIPALNHGRYLGARYFSQLGGGVGDIILSPLSNPRLFWGKLAEPTTFYFAGALLTPLLLLPLKRPSVLFIGSLTFCFIALWNHPWAKSICWHFQYGLLPVLFLALALALSGDAEPTEVARRREKLAGVVVASVILSLFLGNAFWSKDTIAILKSPGRLALVQRLSRQIDRRGTLLATNRAAAHFLDQKYLYLGGALPAETDFVLLDLRDQWRPVPGAGWLSDLREFQRQVEARPDLRLTAAEDGMLLYARNGPALDAQALVETGSLPATMKRAEITLEGGVNIVAVMATPEPTATDKEWLRMRVKIFSTVNAPTTTDVAAQCILKFGAGADAPEQYSSPLQPLGQGIWPTERWKVGKFYADEFIVTVPAMTGGEPFAVTFQAVVLKRN